MEAREIDAWVRIDLGLDGFQRAKGGGHCWRQSGCVKLRKSQVRLAQQLTLTLWLQLQQVTARGSLAARRNFVS